MSTKNTPTIITERLILRRFTPDDTAGLLAILQDREVNTFLPWFPLDTLEEAAAFMQERYLSRYTLPQSYHYAICLKDNDQPVGYVNIGDDDSHDLGYGLHRDFWRSGIVTEACSAIISQITADGIPFITATHDVNNPRSSEVMKRLSMTYQYSYEERVQPKNELVTFRMYQLNLNGSHPMYRKYWDMYPNHFVE